LTVESTQAVTSVNKDWKESRCKDTSLDPGYNSQIGPDVTLRRPFLAEGPPFSKLAKPGCSPVIIASGYPGLARLARASSIDRREQPIALNLFGKCLYTNRGLPRRQGLINIHHFHVSIIVEMIDISEDRSRRHYYEMRNT